MKPAKFFAGAVTGVFVCSVSAAEFGIQGVTDPNVPAGFTAHEIYRDGGGVDDWRGTVLRIDLSTGSFFHHPFGKDVAPNQWAIDLFPDLEFDTYLGIVGSGTGFIAGGAGDIGGGPRSFNAPQLSATWFNTDRDNTGLERIGMVTLSNDAIGTGMLFIPDTEIPFTITNGVIPDISKTLVVLPPPPPPPPPPTPEQLPQPPSDPGATGIFFRALPAEFGFDGYVTHEIVWNGGGTEDWTNASIRIDLATGSVYQDLFESAGGIPPNPAFFPHFPSLAYDTYFGILGDTTIGISGGAGDLGGGPSSQEEPQISMSWFNTSPDDTGVVRIGMITLSEDATGEFTLQSGDYTASGSLSGINIPEPASVVLLAIACPALLSRGW